MHGSKVPEQYKAEIRQKAIDKLVREELAYQAATRRGLQVPPAKWEKRMAEIRGDFSSPQEFRTVITREFGSTANFDKFVRRSMLIEQIWDTEVKQKSVVSDATVANYYAGNKAKFIRPEALSFQAISFLVKANGDAADRQQARKRAEEALPKAKAAKNYEEFGLLAEKVSEDDWRVMMGDHRMVHSIALPPEYKATAGLKEGETSGIVESEKGFHIIRLNKRMPQKQMPLAEMRPNILQTLRTEMMQKRSEGFVAVLKKNAKVEVF
jgi:peptidyl-prolyl cis-trans isomerase C